MAIKPLPPVEYLRECLDYKPKTGTLIWKERPRVHFKRDRDWKTWNVRFAGETTGTKISCGIKLTLCGVLYRAHRIIWAMKAGTDPGELEIDHRNRDPWDNRWSNLRLATRVQNRRNSSGQSKQGLPKGVSTRRGRYNAYITVGYRDIYLGTYATPEKAASVYRAFARSLHGQFYADPTQT